jgi:peptidoglycan/xylan/chitin deacetylase (PgdA/CDA1 family)
MKRQRTEVPVAFQYYVSVLKDRYSLRLSDILSKHQARASFRIIGQYVQSRPDTVREIAKAEQEAGKSHPTPTAGRPNVGAGFATSC